MELGSGNKMVRKVKQYYLDFDKSLSYFKNCLEDANTLSTEILKKINFSEGSFFTILPEEAILSRIYEFPYGGIIPPKPYGKKLYKIPGTNQKFHPQQVVTLINEFVNYIVNVIDTNKKLSCVFEDVIKSPDDLHLELFNINGLRFENEIYYLIDAENNSDELILKTINEADAMWHFLCVLTQTKFDRKKKQWLTLDEIEEICKCIKTIIIGAYDGEGYVFWEKK
jgi:hypothetical protein